jgi:hypothetical protein
VDYSSQCLKKCVGESVKFVDLILVVVVSLVTSTCIELYFCCDSVPNSVMRTNSSTIAI